VSLKLFTCQGGHLLLPDPKLVLVSREDGGNLIVLPPREVWERTELTPSELTLWSFLVAATGKAMLDVLPQLGGGCINYWEAGNWALNDQAVPEGEKATREYRKVHMHLLGRSRTATDPSWKWGEAPKFPDFVDRHAWASRNERLKAQECRDIVVQIGNVLTASYGFRAGDISAWSTCDSCAYPTPKEYGPTSRVCAECQRGQ